MSKNKRVFTLEEQCKNYIDLLRAKIRLSIQRLGTRPDKIVLSPYNFKRLAEEMEWSSCLDEGAFEGYRVVQGKGKYL